MTVTVTFTSKQDCDTIAWGVFFLIMSFIGGIVFSVLYFQSDDGDFNKKTLYLPLSIACSSVFGGISLLFAFGWFCLNEHYKTCFSCCKRGHYQTV